MGAEATGGVNRFVALVRGINVSGHNPVPMKDLRSLMETLPVDDVATYLQSGNVLFASSTADPDALAGAIEAGIRDRMGHEVVVLVRPAGEIEAVRSANPFLTEGNDGSRLYVTFLAAPPEAGRAAALQAGADAMKPDLFRLGAREVYLSCTNGYGRTKIDNAFFEKKLAVAATTRNWRTVTTLAEMARG